MQPHVEIPDMLDDKGPVVFQIDRIPHGIGRPWGGMDAGLHGRFGFLPLGHTLRVSRNLPDKQVAVQSVRVNHFAVYDACLLQSLPYSERVNIVQIVVLGLGVKPVGGDELGDAPLHLGPRHIRRRAVRGHGESGQIVAVLGAQERGGILVAGVLLHVPYNGVFAFYVAVPLLQGRVDVGLGDVAPFRFRYGGLLQYGGHRKSGGLFALRWRGFFCSWFRWRWLHWQRFRQTGLFPLSFGKPRLFIGGEIPVIGNQEVDALGGGAPC